MTIGAAQAREESSADVSRRLLDSAATLSYDPATEIDWDAPVPAGQYGLNPEWSTLYGTSLWDRLSEQQRVSLTRYEVCSIMNTGIWFEMILQQMILRDQYGKNPADPEFRFALTEIADECRHSIMFARICEKLGAPQYRPPRPIVELARLFKSTAGAEIAYGGTLVAEEVLDVMQRDWMRGENVLEIVRTSSKIHVVEESRHMKFARQEVREHMAGIGPVRRQASAALTAAMAAVVVGALVHPAVYRAAGIDTRTALAAAAGNEHRKSMLRNACSGLMEFLTDAGLMTPPAAALYRRANMI